MCRQIYNQYIRQTYAYGQRYLNVCACTHKVLPMHTREYASCDTPEP